jgi:PhoH-like ATPase
LSKKFVVDTSIFLNDEEAIFKFDDNEVIFPSIVWEELNDKKDTANPNDSYLARRLLKLLTELAEVRPLREGVKLSEISEDSPFYNECKNKETLIRIDYNVNNPEVDNSFSYKKHDYKLIACAKNNDAILITSDMPLLGISKDFVKSEGYRADSIKSKKIYKGYRFEIVEGEIINDFYKEKYIEDVWNLYPNEFIVMVNSAMETHKAIGIKKNGKLKLVNFDNELNYSRMKVRPVNLEQKMLLYLLQDPDIKCITVTGISGKGKTLVSCDYAFSEIEKGNYNKFLYTKSIIPTDEDEYMGYNKGSEEEKFNAHIKALFTAVEFLYKEEICEKRTCTLQQKVEELMTTEKLGTLPLANIRGMNIYKKIVMLDEAQNTKQHVIKSLVSRFTDDAKLIVSGDIEQIDDPKLTMYNNGLSHLIEQGKEEDFIAHITLDIDNGNTKRGKLSTFAAKKL